MKCINHPDKDAVAVCVACGAGLCADCRNVVRGASYCDECLKTHEPMRLAPGGRTQDLNVWAVVAWVMVMVGLWPGLDFLAVGGLILGFVALGDIAARGYTQGGRAYARAAIVIAALSLAVKFALLFYYLAKGIELSPWLNPFKYVQ